MTLERGDLVLVEARITRLENRAAHREVRVQGSDLKLLGKDGFWFREEFVHLHPGVPVADMLEELRLLWGIVDTLNPPVMKSEEDLFDLRKAREAAQVEYGEGAEVWVRSRIARRSAPRGLVDVSVAGIGVTVLAGDVRKGEP